MELTIKTAAEYVADAQAKVQSTENALTHKATIFINEKVKPDIEDMIANPSGYCYSGYISLQVPHSPAAPFVAEVARLLTPLGFTVRQSHDGGGMYATIVIAWEDRKGKHGSKF